MRLSLLLAHFATQGYSARLTSNGADFGADLVLAHAGETSVVQAKRCKSPVGVRAIQEVVAAKAHYRADRALVVTNSTFTAQAVQLAGSNGVELWDRSRLKQELGSIGGPEVTEPQRAPEHALLADVEPQTVLCPRCGSPMVRRTGKHGVFWGCPGYPRCRGTQAI